MLSVGRGSSARLLGDKQTNRKEDIMNRLITCTAIALALGLAPALAADQQGQLPASPGASSGAAYNAANPGHEPQSGSADTSGGAAEQSSAPPNSDAAKLKSAEQPSTSSGQADSSGGAAEQSSAPPKSSAAETNKANPTLGMQQQGSQPSSQPE
jgi:hypothetical protein